MFFFLFTDVSKELSCHILFGKREGFWELPISYLQKAALVNSTLFSFTLVLTCQKLDRRASLKLAK